MSEAYVDLSLIPKIKNLCVSAEKEMEDTITLLKKEMNAISSGWKDQKAKEFENVVKQCISSLKHPLGELHRCDVYLQRLAKALEEYDNIRFSNEESSSRYSVTSANSNLSTPLNIDGCNQALLRDGRSEQMIDISGAVVEGLALEEFWNHHTRYTEETYYDAMSNYSAMMTDYANGRNPEELRSCYPDTYNLIFGRDTIRISNTNGRWFITGGRHRIAMAQRLGISHLPAIVY